MIQKQCSVFQRGNIRDNKHNSLGIRVQPGSTGSNGVPGCKLMFSPAFWENSQISSPFGERSCVFTISCLLQCLSVCAGISCLLLLGICKTRKETALCPCHIWEARQNECEYFNAQNFKQKTRLQKRGLGVENVLPSGGGVGTSLQQHRALAGLHGVGEAKLFYLREVRGKGAHKLS